MTGIQIYATVASGVGLANCIVFVLHYAWLSRGYKRSEYWWMVICFPGSLGLLLAFIFLSRLFGDSVIRRLIGAVLYTCLLIMVPWLHRLMYRSFREGRLRAKARALARQSSQEDV